VRLEQEPSVLSPRQIEILRETVRRAPQHEAHWLRLGNHLFQAGHPREAIAVLQEGARCHEQSAALRYNLGFILENLGETELALRCYTFVHQLQPSFFEAWFRAGYLLGLKRQHTQALMAFQRAFALRPDYLPVLAHILEQLVLIGDSDQVIRTCEYLISEAPLQSECWSTLDPAGQEWFRRFQLRAEAIQICYFFCRPEITTPMLIQAARDFSRKYFAGVQPQTPRSAPLPDKRLRVAYLSNEFASLAFYHLYVGLFQHQDTVQFEYLAYADGQHEGATVEVLRDFFGQWTHITHMDNQAFWQQLQADQPDILVDFSGLINPARLELLARKPAPVVVMFGTNPLFTSGLECVDWLFSDPLLTPPDLAVLYPEKVWFLDHFFSWVPPEIPYPTTDPPCLEKGYLTLGCANAPHKLTAPVLALWSQIFTALPTARLCLKNPTFDDVQVRAAYQAWWAEQGFAPERLILWGAECDHPHLPFFYSQIDIALDPFPYQGALTNLESFWMGVPVIALKGERRVAESMFTALGVAEFVTATPVDYLNQVVALAVDPQRLKALRSDLRARVLASKVCQGEAIAREREAAYREMWLAYCQEQQTSAGSVI
jgi:protein O-GlcNAc transferase